MNPNLCTMCETMFTKVKRKKQIISTFKLQLRYFNVFNPYDWAGLVKIALHFVTPYGVLHRIKRRIYNDA